MQRLIALYRAMSDAEILGLAARPDDLTDAAQEVLRGEMAGRGLRADVEPTTGFSVEAGRFAQATSIVDTILPILSPHGPDMRPETAAKGLAKGSALLMTFHDAIDAGAACTVLEAEGMEIEVRDVAKAHPGSGSFYGGVALQIIVQQNELKRAMAILRERMGLFPLQEVEVADELIDDGTTVAVGAFGHRSDAEEVARMLEEAGVWHRIVANAEGRVEDEDCYSLEVKEVDLVRVGEVVERGLWMTEG